MYQCRYTSSFLDCQSFSTSSRGCSFLSSCCGPSLFPLSPLQLLFGSPGCCCSPHLGSQAFAFPRSPRERVSANLLVWNYSVPVGIRVALICPVSGVAQGRRRTSHLQLQNLNTMVSRILPFSRCLRDLTNVRSDPSYNPKFIH